MKHLRRRQVLDKDRMKTFMFLMHVSIGPVTIPPGQPLGQIQPFGPGGGELFEMALSLGVGGGVNQK